MINSIKETYSKFIMHAKYAKIWLQFFKEAYVWDFESMLFAFIRAATKITENEMRGVVMDDELEAQHMKICCMLIDRIKKDEYIEKELKELDRIYGKLQFVNKEITEDGYIKADLVRERETPENSKEIDALLQKIYKKENQMRQQDIDLLFRILKKHYHRWGC